MAESESVTLPKRNNVQQCPQQQQKQEITKNNHDNSVQEDHKNLDASPSALKATRAKTPMCLLNDLARFNKISFQYRLIKENGLAHCKRFTVALKLGDEEYTAEGGKVKEAQHLAAKEAIEKTKYKHPTPKLKTRRIDNPDIKGSNITPTVELNALAMKIGQQTFYIFDPRPSPEKIRSSNETYNTTLAHEMHSSQLVTHRSVMVKNDNNPILQSYNIDGSFVPPNLLHNGLINHSQHQWSYHLTKSQHNFPTYKRNLPNGMFPTNSYSSAYFPPMNPCKITLIVGTQRFTGMGRTLQQAKHDAAAKALQFLKEKLKTQQKVHNDRTDDDDNDNDNEKTSPISLVFEIGIKRKMPVDFKVLSEEGPAHMRVFTTACIVGNIIKEGKGAGKKASKKNAAQNMLIELRKLPPLTPIQTSLKNVKMKSGSKKCPENLTKPKEEQSNRNKKQSTDSDSSNFITKLMEWHHQHNKEGKPEFKLINDLENENSRRRKYTMEVSSSNIVARGVGNSKKLAKLNAAENFLLAIDSKKQEHTTAKKSASACNIKEKATNSQVTQVSPTTSASVAVPNKTDHGENVKESQLVKESIEETKSIENDEPVVSNDATKSTEQVSGDINLAQPIEKLSDDNVTLPAVKNRGLTMKDQLFYLAKVMGFKVTFSDYPKGTHNDFLSIAMLTTTPPQICHGVGDNIMESQEDAAKNALKILREMGLNIAKKKS